jgi:hypothetical protein
MSCQIQLDEECNENLLDGKYLSKQELIERLQKMNIELDNKVEGKQYFVDLYNKLIQQYDRRMKIKSILDADGVDKSLRILQKKRVRDDGSQINSSNQLPKLPREEAGSQYKFKIEKSVKAQKEEKEKNIEEDSESARNNLGNVANKNLDLGNFMLRIQADLNSYKNKVKNLEGAINENKKNQSDKEQPKVIYADNLNFPQSDSRVLSKKPSQRNSRTNLRSVENSNMNIPNYSNGNKVDILSNYRSYININENHQEEKTPADSSASESDINCEYSIKQPNNTRRNGIYIESTASFPRIESRNSRKSLPGSSKNIQEILHKIDTKSNAAISPRLTNNSNKSFVFKSFRADNPIQIQPSQKGNSNSRRNSSRQLIVSVRENPTNVTEFTTTREGDVFTRKLSSISMTAQPAKTKIFNYKNVSYMIFYSVVMAGFILLAYFVLKNTDFSQIDDKHKILIGLVVLGLIALFLIKKMMTKRFFRKAAKEDYNIIKNIIVNLYSAEESPIGLFESNILRDFSLKHQMSEVNYKKFVFPLIKNLRDADGAIIESEVIIQEQAQNVWKLK